MKKPAMKIALGSVGIASALALVGPGVLGAGAATKYVLSDKVHFSAQLTPNSSGYTLSNLKCALTSDGEKGSFACQIAGTLTPTNPAGGPQSTLSTQVTSGDGTITSTAVVTISTTGTFTGKGKGTESDIEKGKTLPPYPCKVAVSGTINAAGVMTGTLTVTEPSTAP